MNAEKLLRLASILDAAHEAHQRKGGPGYNQGLFTHPCGTPACAFGHWAAAHPDRFTTTPCGPVSLREGPDREPLSFTMLGFNSLRLAALEFDLTYEQASELFSADGCGDATTHQQAAWYIRNFVARNCSR